jgi:glycosyltransferase involved in cell wall biosynthesis
MTVNSPDDMAGVRTVLMVAPYVPPHLGGVENYVYNLAVEMVRSRGIRVVVAAPAALGVDRSATEELFSRTTGLELRWLPAPVKVSNTPVGLNWTRALRRIVEDERVDLVNAHAPVPFLADIAARACAGVPFVLTYHSGPMRKGCWWLDAGLLAYERGVLARTVRRADGLICASSYVLNTLHSPAAPVLDIVHPAVDPQMFAPGGSPDSPACVLFVGSLMEATAYKGLATLIDATTILRDRGVPVRLEVVGDGDARRGFEELVGFKGIESFVRFSGALRGPELAEAYRRNAVLAIPSSFDNFPTVALEAMACGLPVVASEVGALPDLVEEGKRGYLVEPGNAGQLADRLADVISDPAQGRRMGAQGRQFVLDKATVASQADRTLDMFTRAAGRRKAGVRNVAVVVPYYPPQVGGVENYVHRVTRALQESGSHHPVVLSASESRKRTVEIHDGVTVIRLPTLFKLSNTPLHPLWPIMLRREFRRLDVDVVYTHSPVPGMADIAAFVAGDRRVVLTYHSGSLLKGGGLTDRVLAAYEKHFLPIVFRRCSALGAVSPVASSYHTGRAALLPPGVDVTTFTPGVDPRSERPTVLFVGRIDTSSRWKGIEVLLEAIALLRTKLPEIQLNLVGSGDAVEHLRRYSAELGITDAVCWKGTLSGPALVDEYRAANVVALPSLTECESFGLVLIEAMACGRPVVGSDVGGIPFVIRPDVDGILVPPGEPAALAAALQTVLEDGDYADRLGARGRERAEDHWDWSKRIVPILEQLDGADLVAGLR